MHNFDALVAELDDLERAAKLVLGDHRISVAEKRTEILRLYKRCVHIGRLLSALLRRYREKTGYRKVGSDTAANVVAELLDSPEFRILNLFLVALFFAVSGPASLYPMFSVPGIPELFLFKASEEGLAPLAP